MARRVIEDCLEEMGMQSFEQFWQEDSIGSTIKVAPNCIPLENIKLAYELCTNKHWEEGIEDE